MLQLSAYLLNRPVISLRTGSPVAEATQPIINPHNLKIEGFYCQDNADKRQLVLLYQDIRESSRRGFVINDYDVLAAPDELIRLRETLNLHFELLKKPVETTSKERVGKVNDYAVETTTMYVQKLYVSQPIWKNFAGGSLSIDRTQIVEITNRRIVVNELVQATPATAATATAPAM